jgi:CRISPR system Cascade subunit CasA
MQMDSFVTQPARSMLFDAWIPCREAGGRLSLLRPFEVLARSAADPYADMAWPRADFRIACLEFLVGLLATACPPEDEAAWRARWDAPPSAAELEDLLAQLAPAFTLDREGSRFEQDAEDFPGDRFPSSGC